MADITEIIEESTVQLEIVETGGGQLEIIDNDPTIIEVIETTLNSDNLDIATKTNTVVIETPSNNTIVDISVSPSTIIETNITNNVIEITENQVLFQTGSVFNITNISQSISSSGANWDGQFEGQAAITGSLKVSDTLFSDILSTSQAVITSDGINNVLLINVGINSPITINPQGLIIFDEFTYTPTPVEGGFLYSGSDFYIGLIDS
tara:strand:+ start:250 stop:870 length:621 start_codon:yes stop_codon:yes gene_type:complete